MPQRDTRRLLSARTMGSQCFILCRPNSVPRIKFASLSYRQTATSAAPLRHPLSRERLQTPFEHSRIPAKPARLVSLCYVRNLITPLFTVNRLLRFSVQTDSRDMCCQCFRFVIPSVRAQNLSLCFALSTLLPNIA